MSLNCCRCHKGAERAVTLVCDHELCVECAESIKKPEGVPPLDAKFRIICPQCQKSTLTHNIDNLINQENDKFLFDNMESSELNESSLGQAIPNDPEKPKFTERELKQMTYSQRFSNIWAERKTPDITERGSKASNDSKRNGKSSRNQSSSQNGFTTQCHIHKENLMFYCEQEKKVMCMECIYRHTKQFKSHKIYQIKQAIGSIQSENKHFKQQARKKIEDINKCITICKTNKTKVEQAYQIHQQLVDKEFKQLELLVQSKKAQVLEYLEKLFTKKQRDVNSQISDFAYLKNCLKEHYDYPLENDQSQLYFFNAYSIMRDAINKGSTKIKAYEKEQLACFDKLCSIGDFKNLLDKFIKPKKDGRESKVQSRGGSEQGHPQKSKSILYDEYKSAKKALDKINKMEKQHKGNRQKNLNYLNNYVIDIQKKQGEQERGGITVRERKSSMGAYMHNQQQRKSSHASKPLTPTRLLGSKNKKK